MKHNNRVDARRDATIAGAIAIAILGVFGAATADAQGMSHARQACRADYETYCSDVQPGGGRVKMCLVQNAARLSPACQEALGVGKSGNGG